MASPVVHFEIMGTDAAKLQDYYRNLFNWEIDANNPMNYGIIAPSEGGIGGGVGSTPMGQKMVTVYVQVPDPQASLDKAVELGGQLVMPVTDVMEGVTIALFSDIDGNIVGLLKG